MKQIMDLYSKSDPETVSLMMRWAGKIVSIGDKKKINEYLKSLFRRELNDAIDTPGVSSGNNTAEK